jgi:hypothetical protein
VFRRGVEAYTLRHIPMTEKLKGKEVYQTYFITSEGEATLHQCKECSRSVRQNIGKGYANLVSHVTTMHKEDCAQKVKAFMGSAAVNGAMDIFVRRSNEKAKTIFGWMDWIVQENLPLAVCENRNFRKRSNLGIVTAKTLKKYMKMVKRYVFRKIKAHAPSTFGLIIDGWSIESVHYFAIFITWTNDKCGSVEEYLIYFGENEDVDDSTEFEDIADNQKHFGFTAADWFDVICMALNELLENYTAETRIDVDNFDSFVEFISADNCSTNAKLCNDSGVPMKGCESHRLNLAVTEMLGPEEKRSRAGLITQHASPMQVIIQKLDRCMGALKSLKNSSILRTKTKLKAERRNKTRWSSLYKMIRKWLKIKDKVAAVEEWPDEVLDLIPDAMENRKLVEYMQKLKDFESVSKRLQGSGESRVTAFASREILDQLVRDHGEEFPLTAVKRDASIIQSKHFENAIYKIQAGLEDSMSQQEKSSVKIFLKPVVDDAEVEDEREPTEEEDYADRALRVAEQRKRRRVSASKYRPTDHVSPTTNVVERANSQAKLIITDRRSRLSPDTVNMLMILKHSRSLWSSDMTIQEILDSNDFRDPEEESNSEEEEEDDEHDA